MNIKSLSLTDFRNYKNLNITFSPHTNVIYGDNAQGKTNILEALYLFSQGRSHRAKLDKELIRFGADMSRLRLEFSDSERDYTAIMQLLKNGRKSISINHVRINKLSMLMSYLNVVMFSPEDLELIKGSPSSRRRFIDSSISQIYPSYLSCLIDYNKALAQKNSLLKSLKYSKDTTMLSVWNEQLASNGARIMQYRKDFIEILNGFAKTVQSEISGEELVIKYTPSIKLCDIEETKFLDFLNSVADKETDAMSALYGVQRDDILILINGVNSRIYASQGQQRTAALALKIAQADYIHSIKDEYPVLLLDDIMSELDINRRTYLSQKIRDKQVFITSTDTDLKKSSDTTSIFNVSMGEVIKM